MCGCVDNSYFYILFLIIYACICIYTLHELIKKAAFLGEGLVSSWFHAGPRPSQCFLNPFIAKKRAGHVPCCDMSSVPVPFHVLCLPICCMWPRDF